MKLFNKPTILAVLMATAAPVVAYAQSSEIFLSDSVEGELRGSELIGSRVYASEEGHGMTDAEGAQSDWQDVGEINDLVVSRDGAVEGVLVDIGGFLGIGERQVAIDMDQISFVSDASTDDGEDYFLVIPATMANLEEAPAYGMDAGSGNMTEDTASAGDTPSAGAGASAEAEGAEDTEMAAESEGATDETASGTEMSDAGTDAATDEMASDTEMTDAGSDAATDEMASDTEMTDAGSEAATDEMASDDAGTDAPEGFVRVSLDQMTADDLTSAEVFGPNNEEIGDVSELVLDGETVSLVVVDVGGFLGLGEKPVALELEQVEVVREEDTEEVRVHVDMTEDELEQLPRYES